MKTNLLLWLLFINSLNLSAQTSFNRAYHSISEVPMPFLVELNGDLFFSTQTQDATNFGQNWLYKHNNSGTLLFRINLNLPSEPAIAFKTLDNKLLLAGGNWQCDVVPPTQTNYIAKYNVNGNAVFQATYTAATFDEPRACFQSSDSTYYSFTDSLMVKHTKTGQQILRLNLGTDSIGTAIMLPQGTILVSAKSGNTYYLKIISTQGVVNAIVPTNRLYKKLSIYGTGKILALSKDNKLYKFSSTLVPIISAASTNTLLVNDFTIKNDTIYCLRFSANTLAGYSVCDTSLVPFWTSFTNAEGINQNAILHCQNNQMAILSAVESSTNTSGFYNARQRSVSLSVINKLAANTFSQDLALVSVVQDSAYSVSLNSPLAPPMANVYLRAKAKIKNVGTRVISGFKLNCFEYLHVACGAYFYQEQFSQINLIPGDSITVITGSFVIKPQVMVSASTVNVQYCFYLTVPDNETDNNLADNELCQNINFLITGIKKSAANERDILVYPNPFENSLTVKSDSKIKKIRLVNNLGEVIYSDFPNKNEVELSLPEISPGIYFVEVIHEKGTEYKKILKQ
ncbi:MAG: T9SS type A sorting domain-containing protein [Bacteroidia bacterium]|nr:T9SS type A sorting domain-containing protein [Bacteroidia bacterium]